MVKFKDFTRPLSVFQVLFRANLIFKDFSKQSCIFKYFSSLCEPCHVEKMVIGIKHDFLPGLQGHVKDLGRSPRFSTSPEGSGES